LIGNQQSGFVVDRDRSIQVWNQPVFSFEYSVAESRNPSEGASPQATSEVYVRIKMNFAVEVVPPMAQV
jgi:hypothetical protein